MNDVKNNWTLEEVSLETTKCQCCGEPCQTATGMVYDDDGNNLAMYVANLVAHDGERRVTMYIGLFVDHHDNINELEKHFASLVLWKHEGKVVTSVVTDSTNPSGLTMTRDETLASPYKALIFDIDNFVLHNDPYIRPYLDGK